MSPGWVDKHFGFRFDSKEIGRIELGILDGLPGLESAFMAAFPNARTQRLQVHAKRNPLERVSKKDREAFRRDRDTVFYAKTEARARKAFAHLSATWKSRYPSAVGVIARDLDSLLRFLAWDERYWPSLRTTDPIERANKESSTPSHSKPLDPSAGIPSGRRAATVGTSPISAEGPTHR
jgi:putative transposase